MRGFKTTLAGTAMTALGLVLAANTASAGWLPGFSGYSVFALENAANNGIPCPLCDSTVTFGVWEAEGNDGWLNDAPFIGRMPVGLNGTNVFTGNPTFGPPPPPGAPVVDAGARYVYTYQVFNSNPQPSTVEPDLENFNIAVEYKNGGPFPGPINIANPFTSGGFIQDTTFENLNADPSVRIDQTTPDEAPLTWEPDQLRDVTIQTDTGNPDPDRINFSAIANVAIGTPLVEYPGILFEFDVTGDGLIPALGNTDVLFLTSNQRPSYVWAETESAEGTGSAGDIPGIKVPEPVSLALFGVGLAGLGFARRRKA